MTSATRTPGFNRPLNQRQKRALLKMLNAGADYGISERELRQAIGKHATNSVKSLVARNLIAGDQHFYRLTDPGLTAARRIHSLSMGAKP